MWAKHNCPSINDKKYRIIASLFCLVNEKCNGGMSQTNVMIETAIFKI